MMTAIDRTTIFMWTPRRKAALVLMVDTKLFTLEEVLEKYDISAEEFQGWADALNRNGVDGLQIKQLYKTGPKRRYRRRKDEDPTKLSVKEPRHLLGSKTFRY
jgi:hypothetical protein